MAEMKFVFLLFVSLFSFRILIGTGCVFVETLRPLACGILAEMVNHIRMDMSMPQVALSLSVSQVSHWVYSHVHKNVHRHAHMKTLVSYAYEYTCM
jgi:hypothetical protein